MEYSSTSGEPTIRQDIRSIYSEGKESLNNASAGQRLLLGVMVAGLAFEWGTGNEALLGYVGANSYDATNSIAATGAAMGITSFVEQSALGVTMAKCVDSFPEVTEKVREIVKRRSNDKIEESKTTISQKFLAAFALGSSAVVLAENAYVRKSSRENTKTAVGYAALIGGGVATIGALSATTLKIGERLGYERFSQVLVSVLSDPRAYLALFGATVLINKVRRNMSEPKST
jgi:hypothetical protein